MNSAFFLHTFALIVNPVAWIPQPWCFGKGPLARFCSQEAGLLCKSHGSVTDPASSAGALSARGGGLLLSLTEQGSALANMPEFRA